MTITKVNIPTEPHSCGYTIVNTTYYPAKLPVIYTQEIMVSVVRCVEIKTNAI